ncbi:hypothetical protein CGC52_06075 [Capnocytophaga sp. H2931]|nr:hypothetical protein CGC52_06075 [Capnocytophaga sp. H2931]
MRHSQATFILKVSDSCDYWTKTLKRKFIQKATGSTFSSISMDVIKNEIVPLPPLPEQKRIVQKIEEIFTELDNIEENLT